MQAVSDCGKIRQAEGGFIPCPECERRHRQNCEWRVNKTLLRVEPSTRATALPVYCRRCRTETKFNIQGLSYESLSP